MNALTPNALPLRTNDVYFVSIIDYKMINDGVLLMENTQQDTRTSKRTSMLACFLGYLAQKIIFIVLMIILYLSVFIIGLLGLIKDQSEDIVSILSLSGGLVGLLLVLIIYYGPYDIVKVLNDTIDSLQLQNNQYRTENLRFHTENTKLENNIGDLQNTSNNLQEEVTHLKLVERGLKTSSETLLATVIQSQEHTDNSKKLLQSLHIISEDLEKAGSVSAANMSAFMAQLLNMEDLTQKLTIVTTELKDLSSTNKTLSYNLKETLQDLRSITEDQQEFLMNNKILALAKWIDSVADGPVGLRATLHTNTITKDQITHMLLFLSQLDELITLHQKVYINREHIKKRALLRNTTKTFTAVFPSVLV